MCGWAGDAIDLESLSENQKKALRKEFERRKEDLEERLQGLNKVINQLKPKKPKKRKP